MRASEMVQKTMRGNRVKKMGLKVRNQMLISAFFPKYKEAVGLDEGIAETERRFQELEYHLPEQRSAKKWGILTKRNVAGTFSRAAAIKKTAAIRGRLAAAAFC